MRGMVLLKEKKMVVCALCCQVGSSRARERGARVGNGWRVEWVALFRCCVGVMSDLTMKEGKA